MTQRAKIHEPGAPRRLEISSRAIELFGESVSPNIQRTRSTIEVIWDMGTHTVKGVYRGHELAWELWPAGSPIRGALAAELEAIESRLIAERASD